MESIRRPPIPVNRPGRLLIRAVTYATPLTVPVVASGGRETAEGIAFLVGFLSPWLVLLLCEPGEREQRALLILMWFWLVLALLPVLMMD